MPVSSPTRPRARASSTARPAIAAQIAATTSSSGRHSAEPSASSGGDRDHGERPRPPGALCQPVQRPRPSSLAAASPDVGPAPGCAPAGAHRNENRDSGQYVMNTRPISCERGIRPQQRPSAEFCAVVAQHQVVLRRDVGRRHVGRALARRGRLPVDVRLAQEASTGVVFSWPLTIAGRDPVALAGVDLAAQRADGLVRAGRRRASRSSRVDAATSPCAGWNTSLPWPFGWKTNISPRSGSRNRSRNRAVITRSRPASVGTIDSDGIRYGFTIRSCTTYAIRIAETMVTIPSTIGLARVPSVGSRRRNGSRQVGQRCKRRRVASGQRPDPRAGASTSRTRGRGSSARGIVPMTRESSELSRLSPITK